jgi:ATP-binding cassette subfamily B (MDR/TAP) protein 8
VVTTHALAGLRSLLMISGCAIMMLQISPQLCAVSFAAFPAAMLLSRYTGRLIRERQAAVQAALADASADAHNALLNIRTLRLFAGERRASDRYR